MKATKIKVNNKSYPIKFGYGSLRLLGELWGLKGFQEVGQKVGELIPKEDGKDISFQTMTGIGEIVFAGMENAAREEIDLSVDDIVDALFEDMASITSIFQLFIESMPKADANAGKRKPKRARVSK